MPRLLVLGAGPSQLGLLEVARARPDVHVIAVDRDPLAVGLPLADERAVLSTEDEAGIGRLARAREIDGIISPGADWPVGIAARVAEQLGLPHPIDGRTAAIATSKLRQRACFAESGVPHPRAIDAGGVSELTTVDYPCVVKAVDRQGQRGLSLVRSSDELAAALDVAREESRGGGVIVEELIDGPEVTVNAVSQAGVFIPLTVTDRLTAEPPAFGVALAHVRPSLHDVGAVIEVARAAVEAIGIGDGPSYTQLRIGRSGPQVMEVAARLGGGHDAELVEAVTGVNLNAVALAFALGEDAPPFEPGSKAASGAIVFLVAAPGRLVGTRGVEEASSLPGVRWVRVYRREGHVFDELRRGADRAGAVLAVGSDRAEALARATQAAATVTFSVEPID